MPGFVHLREPISSRILVFMTKTTHPTLERWREELLEELPSKYGTLTYGSLSIYVPSKLVAKADRYQEDRADNWEMRKQIQDADKALQQAQDAAVEAAILRAARAKIVGSRTPPEPDTPKPSEPTVDTPKVDKPREPTEAEKACAGVAPQPLRTKVVDMDSVRDAEDAYCGFKSKKTSDKDRIGQMKALVTELKDSGPYRIVNMPADVSDALDQAAKDLPNMPELIEKLRLPLLLAQDLGTPPAVMPILLVGPPGVGKTHAARTVAKLIGTPLHIKSYAAQGDTGSGLAGADRQWGNAESGLVFNALALDCYANPVIVLDELDKAADSETLSGRRRNPLNELLGLLEPSTARSHVDRCVEIAVDARHIVWIATANSLEGLPQALLSRFQIVMCRKPDARQAVEIVLAMHLAMCQEICRDIKLPKGEVLQALAGYNPRMAQRLLRAAISSALVNGRKEVRFEDLEVAAGIHQAQTSELH